MTGVIGVMVALAFGGIFVVFQQTLTRLIFAEVALSQGVPRDPTIASVSLQAGTAASAAGFATDEAAKVLPADAIVVFASATCTTCIRLVDDLGDPSLTSDLPLHVYFDSERPGVARGLDATATVHDHAAELIDGLMTPALPYGVIMVDGEPVAHDALPSLHRLSNLALGVGVQLGRSEGSPSVGDGQ